MRKYWIEKIVVNITKGVFIISFLCGSTVLLFIIGNYFIRFTIGVKHLFTKGKFYTTPGRDISEKRPYLPAYNDSEVAMEVFRESGKIRLKYYPYVVWHQEEFHGKYVNTNGRGRRLTLRKREGKVKIFMFGGSTLWGVGVPDYLTIPSILQMKSKKLSVYNFGETGYVSFQEFNELIYQLLKRNIPDIVIFYDGVNDIYAGVYSPGIPGYHQNYKDIKEKFEYTFFQRCIKFIMDETAYGTLIKYFKKEGKKYEDRKVKPFIKKKIKEVLEYYEEFIKLVKSVSNDYGFTVYFIWQPNLLQGTRKMFPYEEEIYKGESAVLRKVMEEAYKEAKKRFSNREDKNIYFFGDIFNDVEKPIYIDWCHLGPEGNKIVAEKIWETLKNKK